MRRVAQVEELPLSDLAPVPEPQHAERRGVTTLMEESQPRGGFIPAETPVQNGTAGTNGTAGGTLNQPVLWFLVRQANVMYAMIL